MVEEKAKKVKLGDEDNEVIMDEKLLLSIEKLSEIQEELDKINDQESDKVLEVEQKYSEIRKPVYERRNEIIKSIPDFWFTALIGHPALDMLISEEDHKMLKHLKSLDVEDLTNVKAGYSITFTFEPNPYFENTKLTKTYTYLEEGTTEITATPIEWKAGMGLPNGVSHEKKGKKRGLAVESFFNWFGDTQVESMDNMQDEIAEIIKDDLWPNPLSYITMEADEEEINTDEADEGDKDGDDSEVEDDEEEGNDDNDEEKGN